MHLEKYDLLVLGSGEAGKYLAWHFAKSGLRTAVVERRYVGGSCPNIACLPSKNFVHSAKVAQYLRRAAEFGISASEWRVEMAGVLDRKRRMVEGLVQLGLDRYHASGAELVMGHGKFIYPNTVEVALNSGGNRVLHGGKVVLSTGTRATLDSIPGLAEAQPLTHIEALELDELPEHLVILGGGYVGLEFAQAFRRFGARVTVVERNERLIHQEDPDVSAALQQLCLDEGIDVLLSTAVQNVEGLSGQHVTLAAGTKMLEGSHLLVAAGRTPNTENIGLELTGVELDDRGYVKVNEKLETTADNVWAVGDCAGSPHFTHIAFDDYRVVKANLEGGHRVTTGRQVPYCLFTDPEFARVGLNESDAKRQGIAYRLFQLPMAYVLRTRTLSETRGFMKALVEAKGDRILGFAALGNDAGELLPAVQVVMSAGLPYTSLRDAIFTHPTMNEGLNALFASVPQSR